MQPAGGTHWFANVSGMTSLLGIIQGGISTADRIVTVSPGYAWEILTPEGGWGMEQMLGSRAYALNGVLNGIDNHDWNPQHDKHLAQKFSVSNFSRGKVRRAFQHSIAVVLVLVSAQLLITVI